MKTKLTAVLDSPRWKCPHCAADQDLVQAIKNGLDITLQEFPRAEVIRFSTDLVHCLNCREMYIIMPPDAYKWRPKKRAEFPKEITVELTDWQMSEHVRLLDQWDETKKTFAGYLVAKA